MNSEMFEKTEVSILKAEDTREVVRLLRDSEIVSYREKGILDEGTLKKLEEQFSESGEFESLLRRVVDKDVPNLVQRIIKIDGVVVGFCAGVIKSDHNLIISLAVHPSFKRKGLAKKLITNVMHRLNNKLETRVRPILGNTDAISFYKSVGFVEDQEFDTKVEPISAENSVQVIQMRKPPEK